MRRHIDLVHSVALRTVQDPHLAKDVIQGVFIALARDAGRLAKHPTLVGWLHLTARNIAVQVVRGDRRRHAREQEAVAMNVPEESGPGWEVIGPQLDAVIGELGEADREAVLLRYFEKKSAPEVAAILGISAEAAQKRVNRAIERMRALFAKRGVAAGVGGLGAIVAANAVQVAPLGWATLVAEDALSAAAGSLPVASSGSFAMTAVQKTAIAASLALLAGTCFYLGLHDSESASAAGSSSTASAAPAKNRPPAGSPRQASTGRAGIQRDPAREAALDSLKRRWAEVGDNNRLIKEQDALAKESLEMLLCSLELYDLAGFMEDKASYGLAKMEGELEILFRSPQGQEARMALAGLTGLAVEGKQDSRLEAWCYMAGKCTPLEGADFASFHAAVSNAACAQEAVLGRSLVVVESDPVAAVAMVLETLQTDLHSLNKSDHLKRLFMRDVTLPADTDFAKLEAMFPPPSGKTDVLEEEPQDWARRELIHAWGERDPEAAADYVMAHPDRCEPALIGSISRDSANPSLEEDLAWANRFPAGPYFDAAAYAVAPRIARLHLEEACQLAERIGNEELRKQFMERAELIRKLANGEIRDGG